jgi:hypothetical protein
MKSEIGTSSEIAAVRENLSLHYFLFFGILTDIYQRSGLVGTG